MKKFSIALAILAAMVFTACNNNDAVVIRLNETELELVKGETKQLTATILPAEANPAFEWFSSNPEYVSVSETGLVKAEKLYYKNASDTDVSPVSIYCKYNGGAAECKVTVTPLDVKELNLEIQGKVGSNDVKLKPGETRKVVARYYPEDADIDFSKLEWATSEFEVISITPVEGTAEAEIKASWNGSALISVAYSSLKASENVIVDPIQATSVTINNKSNNTVKVGKTLKLTASFVPANATVVNLWEVTAGGEYAKIDSETGVLTALAAGQVTVLVKAGNVRDEVVINVVE